jgi:iron complex outermembrane receptor protein
LTTIFFALVSLLGPAQPPAQPRADSTARDTTRLDPLVVSVTRAETQRRRIPAAVGFLDSADLRRGRLLAGLDESLGHIPGVLVTNRSNPSLDQRLVIRGAGSRANFGVRGLKLLIDGIPQTLPDGQSQLSNLDLGLVERVETLLGSASALYGNAGGGVVTFMTEVPAAPAMARLRVGAGTFGTSRVSLVTGGARGDLSGLVALTNYRSDGFRQHSGTTNRQLTVAGNAVLSPSWSARARYFLASSPEAENPGALTLAELGVRRDSAAAANILRGADKSVTQHQAGIGLSHADGRGGRLDVTVFGIARDLDNPLATAPPGPTGPTVGTFSAIDRVVGGARVHYARPVARGRARIGLGLDLQAMRDDRVNRRSVGGLPRDTLFVDQRETVSEVGPFLTLQVEPDARVLVTGAARYDRLGFRVRDRFLGDGVDQSGRRTMSSLSGSLGLSLTEKAWTGYASVSSAFETPTTTELANSPAGPGGFNPNLDPQRATTVEAGVRRYGRVDLSLALYSTRIRRAIIQAREQDGRAYFENAGRLRHRGVEAGIEARPAAWLRGRAAYTLTDSEFLDYRVRNGATTDTLDGKRVPAIPRHAARLALIVERGRLSAEVEQELVSSVAADDRNAVVVDGWGAGLTHLRLAGRVTVGRPRAGLELAPFVSVYNLFDKQYVGSVNVNGFGGRVFEPAPGRWAFVGVELGWRRSGAP